jgi:PleD family two-component response regulator
MPILIPPAPAPDEPPRVLVVDDATVVRLYYRQILEAEVTWSRRRSTASKAWRKPCKRRSTCASST